MYIYIFIIYVSISVYVYLFLSNWFCVSGEPWLIQKLWGREYYHVIDVWMGQSICHLQHTSLHFPASCTLQFVVWLVLSNRMWAQWYVRTAPALDFSTLSLCFDWLNGEDSAKVSKKKPLDVRSLSPQTSPWKSIMSSWLEQKMKLYGVKLLRFSLYQIIYSNIHYPRWPGQQGKSQAGQLATTAAFWWCCEGEVR